MAEAPRDEGGGAARRRGARRDAGEAPAGRVPPHDLDAERSVLSSLLLDPRAFHDVAPELDPDLFYHPAHQVVYRSMVAIHDEGRPVDLITLSEQLNARKQLDQVGGTVFLAEIADFAATAANVAHHARIVRDKAVKRRLAAVAAEIVESAFEDAGSADELLDFAESRIFDVSKAQSRSTFQSLHDEMPGTFDYVEAVMNRGGELTGIPTGFRDLDQMTGGLQAGELIVIAARPSMGRRRSR
jgi:replicative DNA helicase